MDHLMKQLPQFLQQPCPEIYESKNYLVLDFETSSTDKGDALTKDNQLLLAVWHVVKDGKCVGKYSFKREQFQKQLIEDVLAADFIVAHNASFELQWLKRCGLDLRDVLVFDTMIAEYVMLGNRKKSLGLNAVAKRYKLGQKGDLIGKLFNVGSDTEDIPSRWLLDYCKQDVLLTHRLFRKQLALLKEQSLLPVMFTRCLLTPCLADIEFNGATLDRDKVHEEYDKYSQELAEIEAELDQITGGINVGSRHQLAHFLYGDLKVKELRYKGKPDRNNPNKQFPEGMPKTDLATLGKLKPTNKKQRRFIELLINRSKVSAALSKNLEFFKTVCDHYDSTFYARFNQTVTVTHRLSASGRPVDHPVENKSMSCQFQNFPRKFKHLFAARGEGRYIAEADGAQLEFRVAGHLGRDQQVLDDLLAEADIHTVTAETMTEAGEPTTRQEAKAKTFRPLFGGNSGSPALRQYCDFFRQKYQGISEQQLRWAAEAAKTGTVTTETGLKFYFPGTYIQQNGTYSNFTNICNYPIQSLATADIIPISLVYFWHLSRDLDIIIVNTIHDSIICDIAEDVVEDYQILSVYSMIDCVSHYLGEVYDIELFTPLGCGIKIGKHWSVAEQLPPPQELCGYSVEDDDGELKITANNRIKRDN